MNEALIYAIPEPKYHAIALASTLVNPIAREEAALAIRAWHDSDMDFPETLIEVEQKLRKDSRLRVQNVFIKK